MNSDPGDELRRVLRESLNHAGIRADNSTSGLFLDLVVPSLRKIIHQEVLRHSIHDRMKTSEPTHPDRNLTRRESEVLYLTCLGMSIPTMADRLSTTVDTIRTHRANVFRKLGANNPVAAVVTALREGIVRLDELEGGDVE